MKNLLLTVHEVVEDKVLVSESKIWNNILVAIEMLAEKFGACEEDFMMI